MKKKILFIIIILILVAIGIEGSLYFISYNNDSQAKNEDENSMSENIVNSIIDDTNIVSNELESNLSEQNIENTMTEADNEKQETSEQIRNRVNEARKIQQLRYEQYGIYSNSELTPTLIEKYCKLDTKCKTLLQNAFEKLGLSARAHSRILKVARTIADLEGKENIEVSHISEAIQYRNLDKKYWK